MKLNETPLADRVHIGLFGRRNTGKSSLMNAITHQDVSIISHVAGTTTDPVKKTMELLPLGPVVFIDTPGIDDEGTVGEHRVVRAHRALDTIDFAVLVLDATEGIYPEDVDLLKRMDELDVPRLVVLNKSDLLQAPVEAIPELAREAVISVSAVTGEGIEELKETIATRALQASSETKKIVGDLLEPNDVVVLVVPIDSAAPKGRLILPQQQVIRDILESRGLALATQVTELPEALASLQAKPRIVVCDSRVFSEVDELLPDDLELTSFSILFARYKGDLERAVQGVTTVEHLRDDSQVLIAEGCTHHRQCDDIGTKLIPALVRRVSQANPQFTFVSGRDYPDSLENFDLIVHCGGCMLTVREMQARIRQAIGKDIPITNYGVLIAHVNGILERSIKGLIE